ncbi:uncharacterized protein LOC113104363 [Carassius auratus]|uniref:Uncharacterized protein LOC113104363 n=1 Tax=Carassius auratus TaxID=7957 RepID=A0A6P6PNE6_CARAU|nr:uncharacterized protein LOC113104363 [Carassius auratus]
MILFAGVTCVIGIAFGAVVAGVEEDDATESHTVPEEGNLTISIHIEKLTEDPQVLVTRLRGGSSQEPIAQMICHKGVCEHQSWRSGVSLISDTQNVTLILLNVSLNQTGLYKVRKQSNKRLENKIYNITVYYEPQLSTIIPEKIASATNSELTSGKSAAVGIAVVVLFALVVIIGAVIYRKHKKANSDKLPQDMLLDDILLVYY